jgi:hypothetical protein
MKTSKIILSLFSLLLVSCGSFSSTAGLTSTSSNESSSEIDSVSSSLKRNSLWGEELGNLSYDTLGFDLPYLTNSSFNYNLSKDDYGDPLLIVHCFFEEEEKLDSSMSDYGQILSDLGFSLDYETQSYFDQDQLAYITYDICYADYDIDGMTGIELQFLLGQDNGKDCLGIFAFNYAIVSSSSWPTNLLKKVLGLEIPKYEKDGFTYNGYELTDNDLGNYVEIVINGSTYDDEKAYYDILQDKEFTIDDSKYDEFGYYATDKEDTYVINFFYDLNYYNALVIYIFKK